MDRSYQSKNTDWLNGLKNKNPRSSFAVQWVKDQVLSLQQLGLALWRGFNSWPGNFHMPCVQPKIKIKKNLNYTQLPGDSPQP